MAVAAATGCAGGVAENRDGAASSGAAMTQQVAQPADLPPQPKGAPVDVRVAAIVARDGIVTDAVIDRSSGSRSLDESALAAVRAARFGPLPANVKDERVKVIVPIRFIVAN
jgi:TonB family protein